MGHQSSAGDVLYLARCGSKGDLTLVAHALCSTPGVLYRYLDEISSGMNDGDWADVFND
jgi:ABC-type branched-subunit amino acid transport system ATPase component